MAAVNLIGSYNYALVALSVLIAMFASYVALDLAGRVTAADGWTRAVWLLGGAGAMGTGIWSMHYIGMLAFILPIPVAYHWPTVLLSLFAAIVASVIALYVVSRQKMGTSRAIAASVLMGAGIASMHYIGMDAMRLGAICQSNSSLVVLSVVFAVLISFAALWITFHFRDEKTGIGWEKLAGAVVMGAAIPVMHYTGMAAASFTSSGMPADLSRAISVSTLGTAGIAAVTFIVLGLALLTSWIDRRFAAQTLELEEEKLQQSEAYLSEAQQLSHTGSFGWRVSTGEIVWSDETFRIFQYERSTEPTVERVLQRAHPEDAALVRETVERASQDGKDFEHEYRLVMPDGFVKHVHVVAHASRDASGEFKFVGAVMDITERKLAEAERARLGQRLRQAEKMEAVGRLAGGVAHDFNNVLGGILAYGEMLFEEAPGDSSLKRYAQNVLTAANRGRALVEQILAYSHSQRGKRVPVDIARVVAETLELLRGSLPANTHLEVSAPPLPLIVIGDETKLHQVVMNLCSNAIHAMSGGGTLRVALEAADLSTERLLSHGTLRPGRYMRLAVEDSGSGMDEATLSRIFEPFFTTKEVGRGTGLGLSLVYAIVTDLGGAIDVKSVPTEGSAFAIYLLLTEIAPGTVETERPSPRGNGERVLLIDDNEALLAVAAEVISRLGYEPVSFSDSHAALAAFEVTPGRFDVIVTDDLMPGLTGTGLASAVRRRRPDLPIVLVSGYSGPIGTEQALAAGVSELITKPLQSRAIATTLARVLHRPD